MNDPTYLPNNNLDNMSFEIERNRIQRNSKIKSYFHENENYIQDEDKSLVELKSFEEKPESENKKCNEEKAESEASILNPETEIFTPRDPDEVQPDPALDDKKNSRNKKNKNQPL